MNRWHKYFKGITEQVASNSQCLSRKIGAILVRDNIIVSTGYNGPPRGVPHCNTRNRSGGMICPRREQNYATGRGLDLCIAAHAERNAIVSAARIGSRVEGCTMYSSWVIPCKDCMIEIINAGIKEVVVTELRVYAEDLGWWLAQQAGIKLTEYDLSD